MEKEEHSENKSKGRNIPFMILGLKKDMQHKLKVDYYEVNSLIRTLKDYVNCELLYISN
jgi:hypothetical protein